MTIGDASLHNGLDPGMEGSMERVREEKMPEFVHEGRRLHFLDGGGDGTPLLLFHPFPFDAELWRPQVEGLKGVRVIAPDLSGFGKSEVPRGEYSVDRWADEGAALLDHLGIERAAVGGCSMGGYVSFAFLRRHGARARALVLVDTRAEADTEAVRQARTRQQQMLRSAGRDEVLDELFPKLLSPAGRRDPELSMRVRKRMKQPEAGIEGALEAMKKRPDSTPELGSLRLPALVIGGAEDELTPPAVLEGMARAIPGAKLVIVPGAGHLVSLEAKETFDSTLRDFLP